MLKLVVINFSFTNPEYKLKSPGGTREEDRELKENERCSKQNGVVPDDLKNLKIKRFIHRRKR